MTSLLLALSMAAAAQEMRFYVIAHSGPGDPYWAVQHKGAMDAGRALNVQVVFSAPDTPGDLAKEVDLLQAAIAARADGIVVTVPDPKAFQEPIGLARKKGIPVIAFDVRENERDPKALPYMAYIGGDDYRAGQRVGQRAAAGLPKGARAAIATHHPGHAGLERRMAGIAQALKSSLGAKVDRLDITQNPTKGVGILQSHYRRHPDTRAFFALGPLGTAAVGRFLKEEGLKGKVYFATFDLDTLTLGYIKEGALEAAVDQMPYMQAYMAVTQLYLAAAYALDPVDMDTAGGFVDLSNVSRVEALVKKGYR